MIPQALRATHTNANSPTKKPAINEGSNSILFTHHKEQNPVAYQGYGGLSFRGAF